MRSKDGSLWRTDNETKEKPGSSARNSVLKKNGMAIGNSQPKILLKRPIGIFTDTGIFKDQNSAGVGDCPNSDTGSRENSLGMECSAKRDSEGQVFYGKSTVPSGPVLTLQEREHAYEQARKRIFGSASTCAGAAKENRPSPALSCAVPHTAVAAGQPRPRIVLPFQKNAYVPTDQELLITTSAASTQQPNLPYNFVPSPFPGSPQQISGFSGENGGYEKVYGQSSETQHSFCRSGVTYNTEHPNVSEQCYHPNVDFQPGPYGRNVSTASMYYDDSLRFPRNAMDLQLAPGDPRCSQNFNFANPPELDSRHITSPQDLGPNYPSHILAGERAEAANNGVRDITENGTRNQFGLSLGAYEREFPPIGR